jgi:hypothetical protein
MKLLTVAALACGFLAAPMVAAGLVVGQASAQPDCGDDGCAPYVPPTCDGAGCVPYVKPNVAQGGKCMLGTRYVFGTDASGKLYICTGQAVWAGQATPLVGVRTESQPCGEDKGWAQSPDGLPLSCRQQGWTQDYTGIYYPVWQPERN